MKKVTMVMATGILMMCFGMMIYILDMAVSNPVSILSLMFFVPGIFLTLIGYICGGAEGEEDE